MAIGFHSGFPNDEQQPMWINVTASIAAYSAIAPKNLPRMIWKSVSGDVEQQLDRARSLLLRDTCAS